MASVIVIPARYGSTRFPGKPLASIKGRSMLRRVHAIAGSVAGVDEVIVATDDDRIAEHARGFGARVVMTPAGCRNGTERVFAAVGSLESPPEIVVNFQGDALLTPPWILEALVARMQSSPSFEMATPAVRLDASQYRQLEEAKRAQAAGGTLVTFDLSHRALYFSKSMIPHVRGGVEEGAAPPVFRHIGMYAFRFEALRRYVSLSETPLERAEGLEQLRALENGFSIQVVEVDYRGRTHWSVDSPADLAHAEKIIEREGELTAWT